MVSVFILMAELTYFEMIDGRKMIIIFENNSDSFCKNFKF